jgi:hypothetical protein
VAEGGGFSGMMLTGPQRLSIAHPDPLPRMRNWVGKLGEHYHGF